MDVYGKSNIGIVRSINQDDIKFEKVNDKDLWSVICDGMGGTKGGEIASALAVSNVAKDLREAFSKGIETESIRSVMESAVVKAGEAVYNMAIKDSNLTGMGTTVVAGVIHNNEVHVVHIGDSRAYIINRSGIRQITLDHSIVQEMINNGEITKEEAASHPQKNIITRALGIKEKVFPDYSSYDLNPGDAVLMCTDGLTNELSDGDIYKIFISNSLCDIPDKLINEANKRRGMDNITVSVMA